MVAIERLSSASLRLAIRVRERAEATRERQKGCEGEQPLCARYHSRSRCLSFLIQYIHSETQAETLPEADIQRRPLRDGPKVEARGQHLQRPGHWQPFRCRQRLVRWGQLQV
jgi:hypothetical protein